MKKKTYIKPILTKLGSVTVQTQGGNASSKSDHGNNSKWTS